VRARLRPFPSVGLNALGVGLILGLSGRLECALDNMPSVARFATPAPGTALANFKIDGYWSSAVCRVISPAFRCALAGGELGSLGQNLGQISRLLRTSTGGAGHRRGGLEPAW